MGMCVHAHEHTHVRAHTQAQGSLLFTTGVRSVQCRGSGEPHPPGAREAPAP